MMEASARSASVSPGMIAKVPLVSCPVAVAASFARAQIAENTYELDPLLDPRWQAFVDRHSQSSVFHQTQWLKALNRVYGYEPVVVTTSPPGTALTNGIVFCRIQSWLTGRRWVSLPFSDHCEPLMDSAVEIDFLLRHAQQSVAQKNSRYIEIRPLSYVPAARSGMSLLLRYYFHSLDLAPTLNQLFRNFHKDCVQRKIRRAEREGLQYEEGTSEVLLAKFHRLLTMTRRRQYLPPQPLAWFRGLIAAFGKDLKIRVASKDGQAIASILTLTHKKSMVYKYGCSDAAFNNLGGTALLFWRTIEEAKEQGFEELEMGRSDVDNEGLIAFKDRWGATRKSINYWAYPQTTPTGTVVWNKTAVRHLVSAAPDVALKAVGKLLYKHIG